MMNDANRSPILVSVLILKIAKPPVQIFGGGTIRAGRAYFTAYQQGASLVEQFSDGSSGFPIARCGAGRADGDKALDKKRKHSIQNDDKFYREAQRLVPCLFYAILKLN